MNQFANSLTIDQFKKMDALAIQDYSLPIELMMENAGLQLERALATGAEISPFIESDVFVDAYFGFSQKLPLPDAFLASIEKANKDSAL